MVSLDLDTLLTAVSPQEPCGPNLDEEASFHSLLESARCAPKARIVGPDAQGDDTNWRAVQQAAVELFARTKDLRIAATLAKAQLRLSGLVGFAAAIKLSRDLLERYWDHVHPTLDPSDNDATMRLNALRELGDRQSVLTFLRNMPLVSAPGLGPFNFRDISAAVSDTTGDAAHSKVLSALNNCDTNHLRPLTSALQQSLDDLYAIEVQATEKLGAGQSIHLEELNTLLDQILRPLQARLSAREPTPSSESDETQTQREGPTMQSAGAAHAHNDNIRAQGPLEVRSRADVQRMLDLLCSYYENNEPSSPVPILLRRARRLTGMSFSELVRDLVPAGSAELDVIRGPQEADNT
jgi:type VI secretion system protein ImpA